MFPMFAYSTIAFSMWSCLGHARRMAFKATEATDSGFFSCAKCEGSDADVAFQASWGFGWSIFPFSANPDVQRVYNCQPDPRRERWIFSHSEQPTAVGNDSLCGEHEMMKNMSAEDLKACKDAQRLVMNSRAEQRPVPDVLFAQMWRCGECAACRALESLKRLWRGLKGAVKRVTHFVREHIFARGASKNIEAMERRFHNLLRSSRDSQRNVSALPSGHTEPEEEGFNDNVFLPVNAISQTEIFEQQLQLHLEELPAAQSEHHMAMLENALEQHNADEQELLLNEHQKLSKKLDERTRALPHILKSPQCQKALQAADLASTFGIAVVIDFPRIENALASFILPVPRPDLGLSLLIPTIQVAANPSFASDFLKSQQMKDCLMLVNEHAGEHMASCSHERPLMACVARVSQRLYHKMVYHEWWPVGHRAQGDWFEKARFWGDRLDALGAVDRVSHHSCLENDVIKGEEHDVDEFASSWDPQWWSHAGFEKAQCPWVRGLVDESDTDRSLPVFTDKIWLAALHAHAALLQSSSNVVNCPDVLPFATAYCAQEFKCVQNASTAGFGFDSHINFMEEIEKARAMVDPKGTGRLSNEEQRDLRARIPTQVQSFSPGDRLQHWNALWRAVNLTFGEHRHWKHLNDALHGKAHVDWEFASKRWRDVYSMLLLMLKQREEQHLSETGAATSLHAMHNRLRSAYNGLICPRLIRLTAEDLGQLAVPQQIAERHVLAVHQEKARRTTRFES